MLSRKTNGALTAAYHATNLLTFYAVLKDVGPTPYMDELIHIPQARAYCRGDFGFWDPALTTPPGLYLISAIPAYLIAPLRPYLCSTAGLRAVNFLFLSYLPYVVSGLLETLQEDTSTQQKVKGNKPAIETTTIRGLSLSSEAIFIATFPIAWFFGYLYYTETGSLVLVLLAHSFALKGEWLKSALVGAASLTFRQTNILWIAFVSASTIIRVLSRQKAKRPLKNPLLANTNLAEIPSSAISVVDLGLRSIPQLLPIILSYLPVFLGAAAFIKWNGGVVLGDKANHVPTLHLVQPLYFFAFTGFLAPYTLTPSNVSRSLRNLLGTPRRIVTSTLAMGVALYCIRYHTILHRFLLADNRHYTFYVLRRIVNRFPAARYLLAPGYIFAGRLFLDVVIEASSFRLLEALGLALTTLLVIIPSPLIEPRYFLIPYVLIRLHIRPRTQRAVWMEGLLYGLVNAVTMWVFVQRPWTRITNEGVVDVARFMW
ncbi:BZ3500_MvSof-1268-A1-R1_Chr7-1g09284 [Microbotryum saponariae]|uniref:Dol-P-Glc:Glc(2)Man(9)GlcNAc(2)-PP-Dol alpha-1,2-glucosyltransferase n=1 Tax=Microbotryum saponariae TaxID=289078 RepID=A0A2X0KXF8_9BASI|nr:BZ3501_MvSof-1269-A2-R1_Chr7-1g08989 [Microbotryum saponariae]SDA03156.1 BZ3500_MvSof-1268-A1-R1_Chr7-1g09284 [Microbotryum saponariae]